MWGTGSGSKKEKGGTTDRLRPGAFVNGPDLVCAGVPATSDSIALEGIQGCVAVATADGKVKLFGRPGVETTLYSSARYPYATRQLAFLQNRGVLVRVAKGGFVESWSVAAGSRSGGGVRALGTLKARGDKICCVADMARDPYVLLGCASGSLRIAMLVDGTGSPTTHPHHTRGLAMAPYRVRPEELRGEGEVRQLAVQSLGPVHRALVLYTAGMVAVWDLRATQLLCSLDPNNAEAAEETPALAAAGEATAVCWIGTSRGDFATGHVDGSVLVWALPGLDPGEAALAALMRVVPDAAAPVKSLRCVFGKEGAGDGLLVLGGQEAGHPDALTLLPLPGSNDDGDGQYGKESEEQDEEEEEEDGDEEEDDEEDEDEEGLRASRAQRRRQQRRRRAAATARKRKEPGPVKLPWLGHIIGFSLVAQGGNVTGYEPPSAVLQLVEGGQLVLQGLDGEQEPVMLTPPFQQRASVTATEAFMVPVQRPSGSTASAISLAALRKVADEDAAEEQQDPSGTGAFDCGTPPPAPADAIWGPVYCTGYKDGGVALWDLHGGTTRLLCAAPAGDAANGAKLGDGGGGSAGSVACVSLAWPTGLLISGHRKGEVRMYQFSAVERQADCVTLESVNTPGASSPLRQPPGLQLRLRVKVNSGEITSLAYCQAIRAVAAGDKAGGVALIDTARPLVRWYAMPGQQPVLAAAVAPLPLPAARARVPEVQGEEGAPSHAVVVADAEGCLAALDAARGCFVGKGGELRPKNHSYSLALELLDESCTPLWARQQLGAGCDQAALGGAGPSSRGQSGRSHRRRAGADEEEEEEESSREESSRRGRHGTGSGRRGGRHAGEDEDAWDEEDDGDEDDGDMDVEAMLARAAAQVDGVGSPGPSRRAPRGASGKSNKGSSRHGGGRADAEQSGAPAGPHVLSSCPDPTAHYVLLVTDQYLRLYTAASVLCADRSTAAKRSPPPGTSLLYARPVQVAGAPGVLALAAAEHGLNVQVYSLPSLELVHDAPLSASLSWYWDLPTGGGGGGGAEQRLGRIVAASRLGELLLLGPSNELLRLGLAAGLPPVSPPTGLFDSAATSASLLAASEYETERLQPAGRLSRQPHELNLHQEEGPQRAATSIMSESIDGIDSPAARTEGRRVEKPAAALAAAAAAGAAANVANVALAVPLVAAEKATVVAKEAAVAAERAAEKVVGAAKEANVTLSRVFNRVQHGLARAVTETTRGVKQLATNMATNVATNVATVQAALIDGGGAGGGKPPAAGGPRSAEWYASLPDLRHVFSQTVPEDGAGAARPRRKQGRTARDEDDEEDDDDVSELSITDDEEEPYSAGGRAGAAAPRPSAQPSSQPQRLLHPTPRSGGGAGGEQSMRAELFGGARPYTSSGGGATPAGRPSGSCGAGGGGISAPRTRTAEEIKRAYGRAPAEGGRAGVASARVSDVRGVMEENRSRLEERGQRLRQINDKAADLEASAAGFADMARQLAERERNKKWWQL